MAAEIHPLVRALQQYDALSTEEMAVLEALPLQPKPYERGEDIVREGDRPTQSCLVLDGFAARAQFLEDGRRQITAVHVSGDFVDLHSLLLKRMDHAVIAFGPCRVAYIAHGPLREVIDQHRHLSRLLWLSTLVDAAIQRAWITCMGRRSSPEHFAHLLCELFVRLNARGLVEGNSFAFPATQAEIGDILGLSTVHVNRTLQDLRKLGLVTWEGGKVVIHNYKELAERGDFDPAYLNQWSEPR
jgi:CRP-like cAMP-binding protein